MVEPYALVSSSSAQDVVVLVLTVPSFLPPFQSRTMLYRFFAILGVLSYDEIVISSSIR